MDPVGSQTDSFLLSVEAKGADGVSLHWECGTWVNSRRDSSVGGVMDWQAGEGTVCLLVCVPTMARPGDWWQSRS